MFHRQPKFRSALEWEVGSTNYDSEEPFESIAFKKSRNDSKNSSPDFNTRLAAGAKRFDWETTDRSSSVSKPGNL